jgi:hypothetical protein
VRKATLELGTAIAMLTGSPGMPAQAADKLASYSIDQAAISVSGVSSGGYMAQQYHVAHSRQIMGAGILAAGPWDCAETVLLWLPVVTATQVCSHYTGSGTPFLGPPDHEKSVAATKRAAQAGQIDPPEFLAKARVYLLSGSKDSVVPTSIVDELQKYHLAFVPAAQITYVNTLPAEHAMVTDGWGNACDHLGEPYINDCGYDAAGEMLKFIYGPLHLPADPSTGKLLAFDQREFLPAEPISMAEPGYVFVPQECQTVPGCRLHIAFHGCKQSAQAIGDTFYTHAGYNRWAATNRIIVLYPQTVRTAIINPDGCWTGLPTPTATSRRKAACRSLRSPR